MGQQRVIEFATIDSTNSEAHRQAARGDRGPLWIRADCQEVGRGRSGRNWSSPSGNLSLTYLFMPDAPPQNLYQISFVAALWVFDALVCHMRKPDDLRLKWPNDLLVGSAKVGGILIETTTYCGDTVVIVGSGVNLAVAPHVDGREVGQLSDHGTFPEPAALVPLIQEKAAYWLEVWRGGANFATIRRAWLQRSLALGTPLSVRTESVLLDGVFDGLDDDGALRIATKEGSRVIRHGDVQMLGRAPAAERPAE